MGINPTKADARATNGYVDQRDKHPAPTRERAVPDRKRDRHVRIIIIIYILLM